jgi:hypothetical protein
MAIPETHEHNYYHSLVQELKEAKKDHHIFDIQFLEYNIRILMGTKTTDMQMTQVADHISKKYKLYTEVNLTAKTITVYDVYTLDPRV